MTEIELTLEYPAALVNKLKSGELDLALMPVAAMQDVPGARIVADYGIAADGYVGSVALFSMVPIDEIKTVMLDYQSRTSVRLAQLLFEKHWKQNVVFRPATENFIEYINGTTAAVIIGDRALKQLTNFEYVYDLAESWKTFTGLPFVFAGWISNKELPPDFIRRFNEANAEGLNHLPEIASSFEFPWYDLLKYYREDIHFHLSEEKLKGLNTFLEMIK